MADIEKKIADYIRELYGKTYISKRLEKIKANNDKEFLEEFDKVPKAPLNLIYNVRLDDIMFTLTYFFIRNKYDTIVDPTCGIKNYQFSKLTDILEYWKIKYYACDKQLPNWSNNTCDVTNYESLPHGDVFVYDPPFISRVRNDPRGHDYNVDVNRDIDDVKQFYNENIFYNFYKADAKMIIVKGIDQYYPPASDNFYPFFSLLPQMDYFKLIGIVVYRYFNGNSALAPIRIGRSMRKKGYMRPYVVSSYYYIYTRK